jgi:hypothetical protein
MARSSVGVLFIWCGSTLLLAASASAQLATFGDATFASGGPGCTADDGVTPGEGHGLAGYTLVKDLRGGPDGYTCIQQRTDDGNPAPYARFIIRPQGGQIIACVFKDDAVYAPATSGAVGSIQHREDGRCFGQATQCMSTGVCLLQSGTLYFRTAGFVPETTWTAKLLSAGAADFSRLSGPGPSQPDFSATAPPFQIGFYRAKSGGEGEETGVDQWRVDVLAPCASDGDCDDGDACTTETCEAPVCRRTQMACDDGDSCTGDTCSQGACQSVPLVCDDGNECTADSCQFGSCRFDLRTDFATVDAKLGSLLGALAASPCGEERVAKKALKKVRKSLGKARTRLLSADRATVAHKITKQIGKATDLVAKARTLIGAAVDRGLVSAACGDTLSGLVGEAEACLGGLTP